MGAPKRYMNVKTVVTVHTDQNAVRKHPVTEPQG